MNPAVCKHLEFLPQSAPYGRELMHALGLRGMHCGCGQHWREGWLNTDQAAFQAASADGQANATQQGMLVRLDQRFYYLQHDAIEPFPFENGSFDWIYAEHFIEHLPLESAVQWLREVRRLLAPGGHVRLSTPDLCRYVAGYLEPEGRFLAEHRKRLLAMGMKNVPERRAWMVNQIFRLWGHQWIYDLDEIRFLAQLAGFSPAAVSECSFRQGRVAQVAQLDLPVRSDESLYVEIEGR